MSEVKLSLERLRSSDAVDFQHEAKTKPKLNQNLLMFVTFGCLRSSPGVPSPPQIRTSNINRQKHVCHSGGCEFMMWLYNMNLVSGAVVFCGPPVRSWYVTLVVSSIFLPHTTTHAVADGLIADARLSSRVIGYLSRCQACDWQASSPGWPRLLPEVSCDWLRLLSNRMSSKAKDFPTSLEGCSVSESQRSPACVCGWIWSFLSVVTEHLMKRSTKTLFVAALALQTCHHGL